MPHTPGPWFDWETKQWLEEPSKLLSRFPDACLIAAAPSLLAGCKAAINMVDGNGAPPDWDWLRSVIAKATGN